MLRRAAAAAAIVLLLAAGWLLAGQYTRAASLIVLGAEVQGWPRALAQLHARPVTDTTLAIPTREGPLRATWYDPDGGARRTVVLITGAHPAGIDDPRLVHFARSLAAVGLGVVTPEFPRIINFAITPGVTDTIEEVGSWVAAQAHIAPDHRIGLMGISFSGGLAVVAAGRPRLRDQVAFVLSIGGHGDLLRALEALGGGVLTDAAAAEPDAFGLAMVLASVAERVVPPEQVSPLREWARTFLRAAHLPPEEQARAEEAFAHASRLADGLAEPAATLVRHVRAADSAALRPHLLAHVHEFATAPALSPERAPPPRAPVYLLHGTEDDVIPPAESHHLARHLEPHTGVRVLVTPVLTHADLAGVSAGDARALVSFFASLLRQ
jgi:dienelactone hydrolase